MKNEFFIIDFDSTFIQTEALDELAKLVLKDKKDIVHQIEDITRLGMEGKISFQESLTRRLKLIRANKNDLTKLAKILKRKVTPSVKQNKQFFKSYSKNIYIISGGFKDYVSPVVKDFGIKESNILTNSFIFDENGYIESFDKKNPLVKTNGKASVIKNLKLNGKINIIGDGYTDYQIKEQKAADKFYAFTENIKRESVLKKADYILPNFDELLYRLDLPRALSYPKNRIKVLLLENIDKVAANIFLKEGFIVEQIKGSLPENELIEKLKDVSILGIRSKTQIADKILSKTNKLLSIGAFCIGTNQINLKASSLNGISVFNAPFSNTRSVVELVIGEIIMLSRRAFDKSKKMHDGVWEKSANGCHEIRGKKLGIIGYGNIGSQLSVLAESLGMEVYFYDVIDRLSLGNAKKCNTLDELLKISDIISIHVDGRSNNKNLITEREFKIMKDGVIFINSSRGHIVDLNALVNNIKNGKVSGCGIDVFPEEPENGEEFKSILKGLPNIILTPHIGGSTEEAQKNIAEFVSTHIINFINNGDTNMSVNFPNIKLSKVSNMHRLIHIHKNVPGILARINSILASSGINIEGQYLKTNEDIGYVIFDINKKYDKRIIEELKSIPETIKFRILY